MSVVLQTLRTPGPESDCQMKGLLVPQTKLVNHEGSGHWFMHGEKDSVAKDVLDWLSVFYSISGNRDGWVPETR
jgi:hypothetical protein